MVVVIKRVNYNYCKDVCFGKWVVIIKYVLGVIDWLKYVIEINKKVIWG